MNRVNHKKEYGFTLMEVIIAILVMAIGLLGLAALQASSLKSNHSAYTRSQAMVIAYDMIDRMRANKNVAISGSYNLTLNAGVPSAGSSLASQDINDWMTNSVIAQLPDGDASISCNNSAACTVNVQWNDARAGGSASTGNDTTQISYTTQL